MLTSPKQLRAPPSCSRESLLPQRGGLGARLREGRFRPNCRGNDHLFVALDRFRLHQITEYVNLKVRGVMSHISRLRGLDNLLLQLTRTKIIKLP